MTEAPEAELDDASGTSAPPSPSTEALLAFIGEVVRADEMKAAVSGKGTFPKRSREEPLFPRQVFVLIAAVSARAALTIQVH